jgi:hypothetical protein
MRKTRLISILLMALVPVAACTPASDGPSGSERVLNRATAAPADAGFIESVEYFGTGCEGTAASAFSPDNQVVTSSFSTFVASTEPGADPAAAARNCLIMMKINVPAGWSYSLESVDYRGFVSLRDGVTASRRSLYLISGSPIHVTPTTRFNGEIIDDYATADVSPEAPRQWSPCGGGQALWVATQTEVDNHGDTTADGQLTVDSIDTELQWRRCL